MTFGRSVCTFFVLAVLLSSLSEAAKRLPPGAVKGAIVRSDGKRFAGRVFFTRGKRLRVWDPHIRAWRNIMLSELAKIEVRVTAKRAENEWRFKEEGSDEKIFTGRTYPRLDFDLVVTFKKKNRRLECTFPSGMPIYVQSDDGTRTRFLIQPHIQGKIGQDFDDLLYPKEIILDPPNEETKSEKEPASTVKTSEEAPSSEQAKPGKPEGESQ